MNKKQTANTLKVRKGIKLPDVRSGNHSETALKVRKAFEPNRSNHNQTALKISK